MDTNCKHTLSPAVLSAAIAAFARWRSGLILEGERAEGAFDCSLVTLGVHVFWVLKEKRR